MWIDLLLGAVWVAIILIPAIVAYRQPVVSHNGYLKNYMDPAGNEEARSDSGAETDVDA
jgi:hypothetical protein